MKKIFFAIAFFISSVFSCFQSFGQWQWLNPKPSGYINNKVAFADASKGFVINNNGDLFSTTDAGTTWTQKGNFAGTNCMDIKDSTGIIAGGFGIVHLSTDNGTNWSQISTGISDYLSSAFVLSRDTIYLSNITSYNSTTVYYRSTNRGATWTRLPTNNYFRCVSFLDSKIVFAGGSGGAIFKSTNGGVTWTQKRSVNFSPSAILSIQFLNQDTGFAFQEYDSLLRTYDGGNTWQSAEASPGMSMYAMHFLNTTDGYLGGEDGAMYATHDGGKTFSWIGFDGFRDGNQINSLRFTSYDTGYAVGFLGRIMKTTDAGASWKMNSPIYLPITAIAFGTAATGYASSWNYLFKTTDKGQTWDTLSLTTGLPYASQSRFEKMYFRNADTGFVTSSNPVQIHRTFNGGATWDTINPTSPWGYDNASDMQFLDSKNGFMAINSSNSGAMLKTTNGGLTWDTAFTARYYSQIFNHIWYLDAATGFASGYNQLYKTVDSSRTWTPVNVTSNSYGITNLVFTTPQKGFVTDDYSHIYATNDGGNTWTQGFLPSYYSDGAISMKFLNPQIGYLTATNDRFGPLNFGAIYKTTDSGATWQMEKDVCGTNIIFTPDSSVIVAGLGGAILKSKVTGWTLPLALLNLSARYTPQGTEVTWQTAGEQNTLHFLIERSSDERTFTNIGKVAAAGNSTGKKEYAFVDKNPVPGLNYYRLRMVDKDGKFTYSKIVSIKISSLKAVLFPNPVTVSVTLQLQAAQSATVQVRIISSEGKTMQTKLWYVHEGHNSLQLNTSSLASGIYELLIEGKEVSEWLNFWKQ